MIICWNTICRYIGLSKITLKLTPRVSFCFNVATRKFVILYVVCVWCSQHISFEQHWYRYYFIWWMNPWPTCVPCIIVEYKSTWRSLTSKGHFSSQLLHLTNSASKPTSLYILRLQINWYTSDFNVIISVLQMYHRIKKKGGRKMNREASYFFKQHEHLALEFWKATVNKISIFSKEIYTVINWQAKRHRRYSFRKNARKWFQRALVWLPSLSISFIDQQTGKQQTLMRALKKTTWKVNRFIFLIWHYWDIFPALWKLCFNNLSCFSQCISAYFF